MCQNKIVYNIAYKLTQTNIIQNYIDNMSS